MHSTTVAIKVSPEGDWIEVDHNGKTIFSGHHIDPIDLQHILNKFVPDAKLMHDYDFDAPDEE
jgi:hypothetical protein